MGRRTRGRGPKRCIIALLVPLTPLVLAACSGSEESSGGIPIVAISVPDAVPSALGANAMDLLRDVTGSQPGTLVVLDAPSPAVRTLLLPYAEEQGIPVIQWFSPSPNAQEYEAHAMLRGDVDLANVGEWAPSMDVRGSLQRDYILEELAYLVRDATPPVAAVLPESVWADLRAHMAEQGWTLIEPTRAPREATLAYDVRTIDLAILATVVETTCGLDPQRQLMVSQAIESPEIRIHPPFLDDAPRLLLAARAQRRAGKLDQADAWLSRAGELASPGDSTPDAPGHWRSTFDLAQAIEFETACVLRDRGEDARPAFDALLEDLPELDPRERIKSKGITLLQDPSFESGKLASRVGDGWIQAGTSELSWPQDGRSGRCLRMTARDGEPGRVYQRLPIRWRLRTEGGAEFSIHLRARDGRTRATLRVLYGDIESGVSVASRAVDLTQDWQAFEAPVPVSWIHDDVVLAVEIEGPGVLELDDAQFWIEKPTRPVMGWRDRRVARAWLTSGTAP